MAKKKAWLAIGGTVAAAVLAGALALTFTPPSRRLGRWLAGGDWSSMDGAARAAAVGQIRLAVVQLVAAVGAGIALTYRLSRRGQVTDRFTKALERLGSSEPYVRIGGILALEQIVHDAPDQGGHAARVLNAFVRRHTESADASDSLSSGQLPERPDEAVQEALRALTAPGARRGGVAGSPVDLAKLHLAKVRLAQADLSNAVLSGATLSDAVLCRARMEEADLTGADLTRANLSEAQGLTREQVLSARRLRGCVLPDAIRADAQVAQRVSGNE
jgi:hypothetical protein